MKRRKKALSVAKAEEGARKALEHALEGANIFYESAFRCSDETLSENMVRLRAALDELNDARSALQQAQQSARIEELENLKSEV